MGQWAHGKMDIWSNSIFLGLTTILCSASHVFNGMAHFTNIRS